MDTSLYCTISFSILFMLSILNTDTSIGNIACIEQKISNFLSILSQLSLSKKDLNACCISTMCHYLFLKKIQSNQEITSSNNQSSVERETASKRKPSHIEENTSNKAPKLASTTDASNNELFDNEANRQQLVRVFGQDLQVFGFSSNKLNKCYCSGAILELKFISNEILINNIINCLKSKSKDKESDLVLLLKNDSICFNYFKICEKFNEKTDPISKKIYGDGCCFLRAVHHIAKTFVKCSTSNEQCDQYKLFIEENELSNEALCEDAVTRFDIASWLEIFKKFIDDSNFWESYKLFHPDLVDFRKVFNKQLDYIIYPTKTNMENLEYMDFQHFHYIRPIICDCYNFLQSDFHFTVFKKIEENDLVAAIKISKSAFISEIPKFAYSKDTKKIKITIGIYSLCLSTTNSSLADQNELKRRFDMGLPYDTCFLNYQQLMTTLNPIFYVWFQMGGGKNGVLHENHKGFKDRDKNHFTIFPYPNSYEYVNVPLPIKTVSNTGRQPRKCTHIQKSDKFAFRYKDINDAYTLSSEQDDLSMIIKDIALKMIKKWNECNNNNNSNNNNSNT